MEHIEQKNVTDLDDSNFRLGKYSSSDDLFVKQMKKCASTSKDTIKKKRKTSESTTNTLAETISNENIFEDDNSQILYRTEEEENNLQTNLNTLLASIFQNRILQLEVSDYLGIQELS
ncbi:10111_t:CDS:2 [Racocetra fulgida]|uniref:10111_t:CDS:1 n=1 Tax=Racocetra fulgida TaxID=60492 RepID=A0A9N9APF3_9GLOM|nr:10111_t:CDS:2 [Racocetra fulgida]